MQTTRPLQPIWQQWKGQKDKATQTYIRRGKPRLVLVGVGGGGRAGGREEKKEEPTAHSNSTVQIDCSFAQHRGTLFKDND